MQKSFSFIISIGLTMLLLIVFSCTKETIPPPAEQTQVNTQSTPDDDIDPNILDNCDTTEVSYSTLIVPLIYDHCQDCHFGEQPLGGVHLDSYEGVKKVVDTGRFYGALAWQTGYERMPQGGEQVSACDLAKIKAWIDSGAPNN